MENHQLQFVTFDQAKSLKALGFDWPCSVRYDDERLFKTFFANHNEFGFDDLASAPTVALALQWCRDVKKYCFGIIPVLSDLIIETQSRITLYIPTIRKEFDGYFKCTDLKSESTYESAESALLDELLISSNSLILPNQ